jgi:hypothetical protein
MMLKQSAQDLKSVKQKKEKLKESTVFMSDLIKEEERSTKRRRC